MITYAPTGARSSYTVYADGAYAGVVSRRGTAWHGFGHGRLVTASTRAAVTALLTAK